MYVFVMIVLVLMHARECIYQILLNSFASFSDCQEDTRIVKAPMRNIVVVQGPWQAASRKTDIQTSPSHTNYTQPYRITVPVTSFLEPICKW